ncbi:MAG: F0F1 ATP synthase subunit alpha, partial [Duncaniella sp.]|nr:F0F1 ATP synthase subunit alpha [Duncaniella sp.]
NVPLDRVAEFEKNFLQLVNTKYPEVMEAIRAGKLDDDITAKLAETASEISGSYK